jgi:hypothetical protein
MKKLILLFIPLILLLTSCQQGCSIEGSNTPISLYCKCDPNPAEQDVIRYEFYFCELSDTTTWTPEQMVRIEPPTDLWDADSVTSERFTMTNDWVRAGAVAVAVGARSEMAVTKFYKYSEFIDLTTPINLKVIK